MYPLRVITTATESTMLPFGAPATDFGIASTVPTDRSPQCNGERMVMNPPKEILTVMEGSTLLSFGRQQVSGTGCRVRTEPFKRHNGVPTMMFPLLEIMMGTEKTISGCFAHRRVYGTYNGAQTGHCWRHNGVL